MQQSRRMYCRLVAGWLFTMVLACVQSEAVLAQASPPSPVLPGEVVITRPIDIVTDRDGDGEPDELTAALDYIESLEAAAQAGPAENPEAEAKVTAARSQFFANLPYSAETRAIQQQMFALLQQLAEVKDGDKGATIIKQIHELSIELENDPNWVAVDRVLSRRVDAAFAKKLNEQPAQEEAAPQDQEALQAQGIASGTQRLFLPGLQTGQNAGANAETTEQREVSAQSLSVRGWAPLVIDQFIPDPCAPKNVEPDGSANWGRLQRGWIMFYSGVGKFENFVYAKKFTHIGFYHGLDGLTRLSYESNPATLSTPGGAAVVTMDHWIGPDRCLAFGYNRYITNQQHLDALNWIEGARGTNYNTPYSYDFANPGRTDMVYCSSLVWQTHRLYSGWNYDLDSDDASYITWVTSHFTGLSADYVRAAVAPDEIYLDTDIIIDSEGANPPASS